MVGAASVVVAGIALKIALKQWELQRTADQTSGAREATDKFFSEQIAEIRFSLYDVLVHSALAARGEEGLHFDRLRTSFGVDQRSAALPSRYELITRWSRSPAADPEDQKIRDCFERDSAILSATFDSILRAAESSPEAARHVQKRLGRVLTWWMLVWPGAFDHTSSFMGRAFLVDADVRRYDPDDPACGGYTTLWREAPLWDKEQWDGALENYRALAATMFPGDPWANADDAGRDDHKSGGVNLREPRQPAGLSVPAA